MIIEQNPPSNQSPAIHDVVRSDLNLEKWSIWQPANSRRETEVLTFTRDTTTTGGKNLSIKVELLPNLKFGNLTTEDQRVFYALLCYWNEKGQPSTPTAFSLRKLLRILKRDYGIKQRHSVIRSLLRLRATLFTWENSYYDSKTKMLYEELNTFNILAELKIARTEKDSTVNREAGLFKFNEFIVGNIFNRYSKPVFLDTVLSFKSEIAQLLYTRLDLLLADKNQYQRRSKELFFDDLGLRGEAYKNLSDRKRTLERALKELQGKPLTTGVISEAKLEKTEDGADFKAIFIKAPEPKRQSRKAISPQQSTLILEELPTADITPDPLASKAHELVQYFHRVHHASGNQRIYPSAKALKDAAMLIRDHGMENAKRVVDFAYHEAQKTNYRPRTIGGILQYAPQALAESAKPDPAPLPTPSNQQWDQEKAREAHRKAYEGAWISYLGEMEGKIKKSHHEAYRAFNEGVEIERSNAPTSSKPEIARLLAKIFDSPDSHRARFQQHFKDFLPCPVLDFWAWDTKINPTPFVQ
jgi:hypothetical protein